jgi:hypothetical protein
VAFSVGDSGLLVFSLPLSTFALSWTEVQPAVVAVVLQLALTDMRYEPPVIIVSGYRFSVVDKSGTQKAVQ